MWQDFYKRHATNSFEILSVAVDVQGDNVVRPYVEKYSVTYPVLVDRADILGAIFGWTVVPESLLIDEVGIIRARGNGPDAAFLAIIESVLAEPVVAARGTLVKVQSPDQPVEVLKASQMLSSGRKAEALELLREALKKSPSNWRIHKQIWAIENPQKFYSGESPDFAWQKEELEREKLNPPK